jgi:hypothetical protein
MKLSLRILVWIFVICDFCSSFTGLRQNFRQDRSITFYPITAIATQSSDDGGSSLFPSTLFEKAELSATPKKADNEAGAHDSFRYEWVSYNGRSVLYDKTPKFVLAEYITPLTI